MTTETHAPPSAAATDPFATDKQLVIWDDFTADPHGYRAWALEQEYESVTIGSATFHGIALIPASLHDNIDKMLARRYPRLRTRWSMFRKSPLHQIEPHFIHQDSDMAPMSGILYLNPFPPPGDGTTFWRSKGLDWEPQGTVAGRFNRLILFPSVLFHSRAIFENYGTGDASRLVQLLFCEGEM